MLSKTQISWVRSLHRKKERDQQNVFIAEGTKTAEDVILSDISIHSIFATQEWLDKNEKQIEKRCSKCFVVDEKELERISCLTAPNQVLMVLDKKINSLPDPSKLQGLTLLVDGIQDPGNLGTIIRTADWFGVENIICSETTVELWNPKVIQATMGSFLRVNVFYSDKIINWISQVSDKTNVYGAMMQGNDLGKESMNRNAILVLGSEAQGISKEMQNHITHPLTIPLFKNESKNNPDSLNVSIAASIFMWHYNHEKSRD
ncbi:MAG: RNA methyltransferase [Bacteroidota bacterium]